MTEKESKLIQASYCEIADCQECEEKKQCIGCGQVLCPFEVDEQGKCHHCGGIY